LIHGRGNVHEIAHGLVHGTEVEALPRAEGALACYDGYDFAVFGVGFGIGVQRLIAQIATDLRKEQRDYERDHNERYHERGDEATYVVQNR
jgi:hypothetical protein